MALGLIDYLPSQHTPALVYRLPQHPACLILDLLACHATDIAREVAQQPLLHVGMKVRFEVMPIGIMTTDNQLFAESLFEGFAQVFSDAL